MLQHSFDPALEMLESRPHIADLKADGGQTPPCLAPKQLTNVQVKVNQLSQSDW